MDEISCLDGLYQAQLCPYAHIYVVYIPLDSFFSCYWLRHTYLKMLQEIHKIEEMKI